MGIIIGGIITSKCKGGLAPWPKPPLFLLLFNHRRAGQSRAACCAADFSCDSDNPQLAAESFIQFQHVRGHAVRLLWANLMLRVPLTEVAASAWSFSSGCSVFTPAA